MPSADCYSNSDQDCGSVVKYTLQCEYPERVDFGPDKFGAFFGDVELGRIVQEEPVPCTSTAPIPPPHQLTPTNHVPCTSTAPIPPPHQLTPTNHVPSTRSCSGNVSPSDQSSSSSESSQPQYDISSSHIAEHASFVNEYSELNEDPDSRRTSEGRSRSGSGILYGPPPDYVRISVVLLIFSPQCACIALYWALKAKQHMKRGENKQAWQLSNKAFYCLLIGLLCFLAIIVSWSAASLVQQFRNHSGNHTPDVPHPHKNPENEAEGHRRLHVEDNEILDKDRQTSQDGSLPNFLGHFSSGRGFGKSHPSQNNNAQEATSRAIAPTTGQPRVNRDAITQEMPLGDNPKSRNGLALLFHEAEAGTMEESNENENDKEQESGGAAFNLNTNILAKKVPRTTKLPSILLSSGRPRSRLPTRSGDQSHFKLFFNNPKQLLERTTIDPIYEGGVPISSERAASEIPRQARRRRKIRRRPRGRRRHAGT